VAASVLPSCSLNEEVQEEVEAVGKATEEASNPANVSTTDDWPASTVLDRSSAMLSWHGNTSTMSPTRACYERKQIYHKPFKILTQGNSTLRGTCYISIVITCVFAYKMKFEIRSYVIKWKFSWKSLYK
jgi:hypothetical protein